MCNPSTLLAALYILLNVQPGQAGPLNWAPRIERRNESVSSFPEPSTRQKLYSNPLVVPADSTTVHHRQIQTLTEPSAFPSSVPDLLEIFSSCNDGCDVLQCQAGDRCAHSVEYGHEYGIKHQAIHFCCSGSLLCILVESIFIHNREIGDDYAVERPASYSKFHSGQLSHHLVFAPLLQHDDTVKRYRLYLVYHG
ncbi:hypothetical protein RJ55_08320 [Drechmeria coniospora]|nr:hypothetical protein RJ55_08320 [Drechmeria coniospora]